MIQKVTIVFAACALALNIASGGSGRLDKKWKDNIAVERGDVSDVKFKPLTAPDPSTLSLVGNSTTITGFWDFQINGGACEMIRVNPANGKIHAIMMIAEDSLNQSTSRRTAYAMSTNNGTNWNNFNNLRVPDRRSGYPFLDLGQGAIAGGVIIANHSVTTGTILQSTAFVDFPEGGGAFSEISPPPLIEPTGADEPVWPAVAGGLDGSIIMAPGRLTANTSHITRTSDYISWSPWLQFPGSDQGSARNVVVSNGTGRVAVVQQATFVSMLESTDNGASWPATPLTVFPLSYTVGSDTTQYTTSNSDDAVYNGNNLLVATEAIGVSTTTDQAQIHFWSAATGIQLAVAHDPTRFISALATAQVFHSTLGYPVIGMSGNTIVIVFAAFQQDVSSANFNYSDLWWTASTNGGTVWSTPVNLTNTPTVDERYPSISKWNPPGFANIVWQEKLDPGSSVRTEDGRPITRANQKFLRFGLTTDVREGGTIANAYKLSQNYPNPFNPATVIDYTVAQSGHATIKVYDMVGKEVAVILSENVQPGTYQASFDGSKLPSGVYMYQLRAGSYSESRKMILLK
jgi:hypothetical protein